MLTMSAARAGREYARVSGSAAALAKAEEEFSLLVQAGMSPGAAIRAATLDATTLLDRAEQLGSIQPGKDADIIAVAVSPLSDITELQRIRFVMRRGIVHKVDGVRQAFPVE